MVSAVWVLVQINPWLSELSEVQCAQQQAQSQGIEVSLDWSLVAFESGRRRGFFVSRSWALLEETLLVAARTAPVHRLRTVPCCLFLSLFIRILKPVIVILGKGPNSLLCVFLLLFMQISATSLMSPLAWKGVRPMARWPRSPTGRKQGRHSG